MKESTTAAEALGQRRGACLSAYHSVDILRREDKRAVAGNYPWELQQAGAETLADGLRNHVLK